MERGVADASVAPPCRDERDSVSDAETRGELHEIATVFDRAAVSYDTELEFFSAFAADLVAWRPLDAGARVLDLCTGTGACLVPLAASRPARLVGIDLSTEMLLRARARCAEAGIPVELFTADAHRLPFEPSSFDAFFCALSWQFFARPDRVLSELTRTGEVRARLAISLIGTSRHTWPFLGIARAKYARASLRPSGPLRGRPDDVEKCLQRVGWRVADVSQSCRDFEFDGPEHWLAWQWSHTGRKFFEHVDEGQRPALLDYLLTEAESAHRRTGLRMSQVVHFISAFREEH